MRLAFLLLLFLAGNAVQAACEIEPGHVSAKLSESALKVRNDFYVLECIRAGGTLIDITDPTLKGRLQRPQMIIRRGQRPAEVAGTRVGPMGDLGKAYFIAAPVMLAYTLDTHGVVQHITVLETSGDKRYDAAVAEWFLHGTQFKRPATLDGRPIPVLLYLRYSEKVTIAGQTPTF